MGASKGKKFFVNLCSSVVIEEPTDKTGKPIKGDRTVADGLNIPLIVGPVRPADASSAEKDKELYVDVVLHPRVIELANKEKYFKAQIVDLALDWVIQETKVECDRKWTHVTNAYKGGRGEKRDTPVLFFVDATGAPVSASPYADSAASASAATGPTAAPSPVLSSTSSLLSQIHKEKSGQAEEATAKVDIFAATASKAGQKNTKTTTAQDKEVPQKPKVTLIQEIGAPSPKSPFSEEPVTTRKNTPAAAAAVPGGDEKKKASFSTGFLNKTSASSTSTASSGSAPSANKAASKEAKTVSSSALLDPPASGNRPDPFLIRPSTTVTPTASTAATSGSSSNKASAPSSTAVPLSTISTTFTTSTSSAAPAAVHSVPSAPAVKQPTKMEYHQMEQLLSSFDEEFSSASGIMNGDSTFLV